MIVRTALSCLVLAAAAFSSAGDAEARRLKFSFGAKATAATKPPTPRDIRAAPPTVDIGPSVQRGSARRDGGMLFVLPRPAGAAPGQPAEAAPEAAIAAQPAAAAVVASDPDEAPRRRGPAFGFQEVTASGGFTQLTLPSGGFQAVEAAPTR
ncbi:MAG TPA: hypothetical protein VIL72_01700 [Beijerinckiaceae bacterium]